MSSGYAIPGGVGTGLGTMDPMGKNFLESNPDAAYTDWLAELGLLGSSTKDKYAQSRFEPYYDRYKASLARDTLGRAQSGDPNLNFTDFLRTQNINDEFNLLGARDRGLNPTAQAPRLKWLMSVV